jgi:hypothetical protein
MESREMRLPKKSLASAMRAAFGATERWESSTRWPGRSIGTMRRMCSPVATGTS